jgi:histidyl-tRNA synthetase
MGQAVAVRTDYTASEVRRLAKRAKDAAQARRLLAIAAVFDGPRAQRRPRSAAWIVRRCGTG